jgi:hypothetical protein
MTSGQQALILFAIVVGVVVYWKGNEVDIPFFNGGSATASAGGASAGVNDSNTVQPGLTP